MKLSSAQKVTLGFGLALVMLAAAGWLSFSALNRLVETSEARRNAYVHLGNLEVLVSLIKDAETGQRGFLLTGEQAYLAPYHDARAQVDQMMQTVAEENAASASRRLNMDKLRRLVDEKLAELDQTISLRKEQGAEAALRVVRTDRGKIVMDEIRQLASDMEREITEEAELHQSEARIGARAATISIFVGSILACIIVAGSSWVVHRDMAKRLESEQALRIKDVLLSSMVESMGEGLVVADEHGNFLRWNAAATEILGIGPVALPPEEWSRIYGVKRSDGETPFPPHELPLARAMRGECVKGVELVIRNSHLPKPIWILCNAQPLKDPGGKVWGGVIVFSDITERKRAERAIHELNEGLEQRVKERTWQLSEANSDLAQKNQENEMFVYSVSHDLRSPLVNLQGFSKELALVGQSLQEILADSAMPATLRERGLALLDGDMGESIRFIQTGVLRLSNIIDSLLRLSRAGRVEYQWDEVNVQDVVQRIVDSMKASILSKGAEITVRELPAAWGDATAIEQLFANLIGNALNYLDPQRPGRIEVGCMALDPGRAYFVKDNGLGIAEAHLNKMFQAFQRLHPGVAPGEGIGLAIVRRIVERHRGKIWLESTVGHGSTFFVTLPSREAERDGRPSASSSPNHRQREIVMGLSPADSARGAPL